VTQGALVAAAVQTAFNGLLAMDPEVAGRLDALSGGALAIEIRGLGLTLYLQPRGDRLQVSDQLETEPNATLAASPLDLARQLTSDDWAREMELRGDAGYAQQFHAILRALEFDWEEPLSRVLGDVAAHQLGNLLRGVVSWGSQAGESLGRATADYLQEESRELPTAAEVERFVDAVDALRADCDRLAARVHRLERFTGYGP